MFKNAGPRPSRRGFTLIELLVVVAIIGLIVALLLPAVQAAREVARRARCSNNLKQIGVAIHQHIEARGALPGGMGRPLDASYLVQILPYLEQAPLYDSINMTDAALSLLKNANMTVNAVVFSSFLCPSEPSRSPMAASAPNYAANAGTDSYPGDGPFIGAPLPTARIRDGLSQTAGVAEWIVGNGDFERGGTRLGSLFVGSLSGDAQKEFPAFVHLCDELATDRSARPLTPFKGRCWLTGELGWTRYTHLLPPNRPSCQILPWEAVTAGSFHNVGANVLWLDGRVGFVVESIDPEVWHAVGTRSGGEVVSADALN